MSTEFEQWQKEHSPDRKVVSICFDRELLVAYEEAANAVAQHRQANTGMLDTEPTPEAKAASALLEDLRGKVRAAQKPFEFVSIGAMPWGDLMAEHPPVGDQRTVVTLIGQRLEFNPDTFVPVALARCCSKPGMTLEQAHWFCQNMPVKEVDRAFGAVMTCNVTGLESPFDDTDSHLPGVPR